MTVVWTHPPHRAENHDPEPVLAAATGGEVVGVCDFCTAPGPDWVVPCRSFEFGGRGFAGDWAACTSCKDLLVANDLEGLVARAVPAHEKTAQVGTAVRALFLCVDANRTGDPEALG